MQLYILEYHVGFLLRMLQEANENLMIMLYWYNKNKKNNNNKKRSFVTTRKICKQTSKQSSLRQNSDRNWKVAD